MKSLVSGEKGLKVSSPFFSLSKNAAPDHTGIKFSAQMLKKRAINQLKAELFQLHAASFFRFMHATFSVTQFVTRAKPL